MGDIIIILILAGLIFFAARGSLKHFKGEGGCCGGGSIPEPKKKKLQGKKIAEKVIYIEGMHCENCKNSIEKHLNELGGVAAKVNLRKKAAVVSMDCMITDEELKKGVESAGFKVTKIE